MKIKKIIIIAIIGLLVLAAGIGAFLFFREESKKITGPEWFDKQATYMESFETYSDSIDEVLTLYMVGSITEEDFLNHLTIFKQQLQIAKVAYDTELAEHPVKTGTHTYWSKKGCEAVVNCFQSFNDLLVMMEDESGNLPDLTYKYLAFHQRFIDDITDYAIANTSIEDLEEVTDGE